MLVEAARYPFDVREKVLEALIAMTRETDIVGWYEEGTVASVLFTEIAHDNVDSTTTAIMNRASGTLKSHLSGSQFDQISLSLQLYPDRLEHGPSSLHASAAAPGTITSLSVAAELP
jgi:hypothetical protein